jgi:hypothetical protein
MATKLRFFLALTAVAALSFGMVGCELEEDADADSATSTRTDMGETTSDMTTTTTPDPDPYAYVRIDDLSDNGSTPDSGADIDAIILDKADGSTAYAESVEAYLFGQDGPAEELNAVEATGNPDAFEDYPNVDNCRVDGGFVSLGGTGGVLIMKMSSSIETGDELTVLEVGGCDHPNGVAIVDEIEISVGISKELDGQWVSLGSGDGPALTFSISTLP